MSSKKDLSEDSEDRKQSSVCSSPDFIEYEDFEVDYAETTQSGNKETHKQQSSKESAYSRIVHSNEFRSKYKKYRSDKRSQRFISFVMFIFAVVFSYFPIVLLWEAVKNSYEDSLNIFSVLFIIGCLFVLGVIWFVFYCVVAPEKDKIDDKFNDTLSEDEKEAYNHYYKTKRFTILVLAVLLVVTGIVYDIAKTAIEDNYEKNRVENIYNHAVALYDNGQYKEAEETFQLLYTENYRDTRTYIKFCTSHIYYEKGNMSMAYTYVENCSFNYLSEQKQKVENLYVSQVKEARDKADEEYRRKMKDLTTRYIDVLPFVGMDEYYIEYTAAGVRPRKSSIKTVVDGEYVDATLYKFAIGKWIHFKAIVYEGVVVSVEDLRDNEELDREYVSSKRSSSSGKKDKSSVNDYDDPEDFYDDYYDDFADYDEAEIYYDTYHD